MRPFEYHRPASVPRGGGAARRRPGQAARRRHDAAPDNEDAAGRACSARRSLGDCGARRHRGIRHGADHRRDDAARHRRAFGGREEGDPCARGAGGWHRRPAVRNRGTIGGSLANNDPTADYPAAVLGAWRDDRDRQAGDRGGRLLQGLVRDGARARRDHHVGAFSVAAGCRLRQAAQSRRRATPSSAYSSRNSPPVFASRVTGAGPCVFRAEHDRGGADARISPRPPSRRSRSIPRRCRATSTPTPNTGLT